MSKINGSNVYILHESTSLRIKQSFSRKSVMACEDFGLFLKKKTIIDFKKKNKYLNVLICF